MRYGSIGDCEGNSRECETLLSDRSPMVISDKRQSKSTTIISWSLFSLTVSLLIFLGARNLSPSNIVTNSLSELETGFVIRRVGYPSISSISNSEGNVSPVTYGIFKDFFGVIEPHSPMIIELSSYSEEYSYHYSLKSYVTDNIVASGTFSPSPSSSTLSSESITLPCVPYDEFSLKVSIVSNTGETVMESTYPIICLYVRREIRSLQPDDLAKVMDAMLVMYTLDDSEGKALYGDNFHSSTHFVEWHFFNSATRDTNHLHEGTAFLVQHVKATNMVERTLQAVDPSVSLPYWDYTIEGTNGTAAYDSPIFTENIFGSFSMPKDLDLGFTYANDNMLDGAIPNGRFAHLKADLNTKYTSLKQSYGYMRSPWNFNPSPYVSRFTISGDAFTLPSCSAFYCDLEMTDMNTYLSSISNLAHGTTHLIGAGIMGCDVLQPMIDLGYINTTVLNLCSEWTFMFRAIYRDYIAETPEECTVDSYDFEGTKNCTFQCSDSVSAGEFAYASLSLFYDTQEFIGNVSFASYLSDFVCGGNASKIFCGDHLESASPGDPSFWPIHPNLERVFHAKLLSGGFETEDWPTEEKETCQNYQCYANDTGKYENPSVCCYGHHLHDRVYDYETGTTNAYIGATNKEAHLTIDPRYDTYNVTYIYDSFVWNHCEEAGYGIASLLEEFSANMTAKKVLK